MQEVIFYLIGRLLSLYFIPFTKKSKFFLFSLLAINSIASITNIYITNKIIFQIIRFFQEVTFAFCHSFYFYWIQKCAPEKIKSILIGIILIVNPLKSFIIEIFGALCIVNI